MLPLLFWVALSKHQGRIITNEDVSPENDVLFKPYQIKKYNRKSRSRLVTRERKTTDEERWDADDAWQQKKALKDAKERIEETKDLLEAIGGLLKDADTILKVFENVAHALSWMGPSIAFVSGFFNLGADDKDFIVAAMKEGFKTTNGAVSAWSQQVEAAIQAATTKIHYRQTIDEIEAIWDKFALFTKYPGHRAKRNFMYRAREDDISGLVKKMLRAMAETDSGVFNIKIWPITMKATEENNYWEGSIAHLNSFARELSALIMKGYTCVQVYELWDAFDHANPNFEQMDFKTYEKKVKAYEENNQQGAWRHVIDDIADHMRDAFAKVQEKQQWSYTNAVTNFQKSIQQRMDKWPNNSPSDLRSKTEIAKFIYPNYWFSYGYWNGDSWWTKGGWHYSRGELNFHALWSQKDKVPRKTHVALGLTRGERGSPWTKTPCHCAYQEFKTKRCENAVVGGKGHGGSTYYLYDQRWVAGLDIIAVMNGAGYRGYAPKYAYSFEVNTQHAYKTQIIAVMSKDWARKYSPDVAYVQYPRSCPACSGKKCYKLRYKKPTGCGIQASTRHDDNKLTACNGRFFYAANLAECQTRCYGTSTCSGFAWKPSTKPEELSTCELYDKVDLSVKTQSTANSQIFCEQYLSTNANGWNQQTLWNRCQDSSTCLQQYSGWGDYTCDYSSDYYCKWYPLETQCCPKSCKKCP